MRDFQCNWIACAQVRTAKFGCHAATRHQGIDAVIIYLVAGRSEGILGREWKPLSEDLVMSAAIDADALNASNADQLNANIIAAVSLLRHVNQVAGSILEFGIVTRKTNEVIGFEGMVQAVGTEHEYITGKNLVLAGFDADEEVIS